jgi:hypothetical protein
MRRSRSMACPRDKGRVGQLPYLYRRLGGKTMLRLLGSRILSINHFYILGKNLLSPADGAPAFAIKAPVTEATEEDIAQIEASLETLEENERKEVVGRLLFYWSGFRNCYVVKNGGKIAFLQWIIYPSENGIIQEKFSTKFSPLGENQVMIENAFTFPRYRGMGYLRHGTSHLLEVARSKGYKSAVSYIRKDRVDSLNEFVKMGFRISRLVAEYKVLGREWRKL